MESIGNIVSVNNLEIVQLHTYQTSGSIVGNIVNGR